MKLTPIALTLLALATSAPSALTQQRMPQTPGSAEIIADGVRTVFYDIRDLILDRVPEGIPDRTKDAKLAKTQDLVNVLKSVIDGRKRGLVSIEASETGQIIVAGAPATHEYVEEFLEAQRRSAKSLPISMLLFEMPAGHLKKLGLESSSAIFENDEDTLAFLERVRSDGNVSIISTPMIVVQPRSSANLSVLNQISYISDYILQIVEPGNTEILDPVIGVVEDGITIDVRAVPVPGGVVQFDLEVKCSVLQRPIPTIKTRIQSGDGPEVEISLPVVDSITLNSVLALPPGSAALISSASPSKDRDFAILVQFPKARGPFNQRVSHLFDEMQSGTYAHRWFPPLQWEDIPALLEMATSQRMLTVFPTNPLTSQTIKTCPKGVVALWLIEGLREGGNLPSLTPILLQDGSGLSLTDAISSEQQLKLLAKARIAYSSWWKLASKNRKDAPSPLSGTGLRWF